MKTPLRNRLAKMKGPSQQPPPEIVRVDPGRSTGEKPDQPLVDPRTGLYRLPKGSKARDPEYVTARCTCGHDQTILVHFDVISGTPGKRSREKIRKYQDGICWACEEEGRLAEIKANRKAKRNSFIKIDKEKVVKNSG